MPQQSVYARLAFDYLKQGAEDKVFNAGQKTLQLNPENVDVLALMAMLIPRRVDTTALSADQQLTRAETYAKQAITLIPSLPKPATITDEEFAKAKNDKLAMAHSGLGMVYFQRQRYADSANEYTQATTLAAQVDPADLFMLGVSLQNGKKFSEAADAFGKCAEVAWAWQDNCKKQQDVAKKSAAAAPKP